MTIQTDTTPNPNSVKLTPSEGALTDAKLLAIKTPEDAQGDPLGEALIELEGVVDVFLMPAFITLTKADNAEWGAILDDAKALITEHCAEAS